MRELQLQFFTEGQLCAKGDPSLRLKTGSAQDDAIEACLSQTEALPVTFECEVRDGQ